MDDDLREYILKAQLGDHAAFEKLYERFNLRIHPQISRWVKSSTYLASSDSDDISQSIWLKIWENLPSFRMASNFYSWAYRIAFNEFIEKYREGRRSCCMISVKIDIASDRDIAQEPMLYKTDSAQYAEKICEVVLSFSPKIQVAYILYITGASYKQISYVLGISEDAARWRVHFARKRLKEAFSNSFNIPIDEVSDVVISTLKSGPPLIDRLLSEVTLPYMLPVTYYVKNSKARRSVRARKRIISDSMIDLKKSSISRDD
jgi:RNA polymerase sigma-70 factor, ECF subfamily